MNKFNSMSIECLKSFHEIEYYKNITDFKSGLPKPRCNPPSTNQYCSSFIGSQSTMGEPQTMFRKLKPCQICFDLFVPDL